MKKVVLLLTLITIYSNGFSQHGEDRYVPETNPIIVKKISEWQNIKFGLLMHWGSYSQWGIVESWSFSKS